MRLRTKFLISVVAAIGISGSALAQEAEHDSVEFITGSPTGTWFPVASVVAEITNKAYSGQPMSIIPGAGGVGNPLRVGTGQSDVGISYGPFLALAQQGNNDTYKEPFPKLRAIGAMTSNALHIVTAGDLDFKTMKDEKPSITAATGPTGSTELFSLSEVLGAYDVSLDDIESWGGRVERLNTAGRTDGWSNRQFDLVNFFINPPAASLTQLMTARDDSKILSIDSEVAQTLADKWDMLSITIPGGTYPNQDEDVVTVGMPYVYFTTTDMDADFIYNITKSIAENQERLTTTQSSFADWNPETMFKGVGIDLHEGAAKYYRERGWIE